MLVTSWKISSSASIVDRVGGASRIYRGVFRAVGSVRHPLVQTMSRSSASIERTILFARALSKEQATRCPTEDDKLKPWHKYVTQCCGLTSPRQIGADGAGFLDDYDFVEAGAILLQVNELAGFIMGNPAAGTEGKPADAFGNGRSIWRWMGHGKL